MTEIRMLDNFTVPPPFTDTTGGSLIGQLEDQLVEFFDAIRSELQLSDHRYDSFFERRSYCLILNGYEPTESWISTLMFYGEQQIASVLDMRNDANFHSVTFSAHALSVFSMRKVLDLRATQPIGTLLSEQ